MAAIAALVFTGAAIAAPAAAFQEKQVTPRKPAAQAERPAIPTPTPVAKKNERPAVEAQAGVAPSETPNAESSAKKNARADGDKIPSQAAPPTLTSAADGPGRNFADEVRYSFEFSQPQFLVSRYLIEHDASGRGRITFERKNQDAPLSEPIEISPAAYARIVAAWEALRFIDSEESYQADKQFPHLGTMRLGMKRGGRERKSEFNWTHNDQALALSREYRALAEQQLFVFDMALAREYQPSEAIKVLKRLEHLIGSKQISDAGQLVSLLRDLITDERIPLIARNHAERLLKKIEK